MTGAPARLAATIVLAAAPLAACGGAPGYTPKIEQDFLRACTASGASRAACRCAFRSIRDAVAYDDFRAADDAIRRGRSAQPGTQREIRAALRTCV